MSQASHRSQNILPEGTSERMDSGASGAPGRGDSKMETLEEVNGTPYSARQGQGRKKSPTAAACGRSCGL